MYRLLLTGICMILSFGVHAQWQQLNGPCGTGIGSLNVSDSVIYAGGQFQAGEFFLSYDNGDNWESVNKGLPPQSGIYCIAILDSMIFAIAGGGHLYKANRSDYQWIEDDSWLPPNTAAGHILKHDSLLFLFTKKGIFKSDDTGNQWELMGTGIPATCMNLIKEQGNRIFIGSCYGDIYYSENNCQSWIQYNTISLPEIPIRALIQMDSIMIVGSTSSIYRTTDYGTTWIKVTSGTTYYEFTDMIYDSCFIYASSFWHGILRSQDKGESWIEIDTGLCDSMVYDLDFGNGFLIAGTRVGIFKSFDQGNTWLINNSGLTKTSVTDFIFNGSLMFAGTYLGVSRSVDGGNSWDLVLTRVMMQTDGYISALCAKDSMIYAGTYCSGSGCAGIFRSNDGGNTWEQKNEGLTGTDVTVINSNGSLLFAGTNNGLFRSDNNGDNWLMVYGGQTIYDIAFTEDSIFIACYSGVYCSTDNGNSWAEVNEGLDHPWFFSLHSSGSRLYGGASYFYRSEVQPVAWEKITSGITLPASVHGITSNDSLVFFGDLQGVYVTANNGGEWFLLDAGFPEYVYVQSLLVRDSLLYAGTYRGIWKRPLSEMYLMEAGPDTVVLEFGQSASAKLYIHTNADWSLVGMFPGWLSVDILSGKGSDTVTFTAQETNYGDLPRLSSIQLVSSFTSSISVTILQKSYNGFLVSDTDSLVMDWPSDSRDTLFIFANVPWGMGTVLPDWCDASVQVGNGNDTIIFRSLSKNPTAQPRTFEVAITAIQVPPVNVSVTQKGKPASCEEEQSEGVRIYPVPSDGSFCVESRLPVKQITVFLIDGTVLETREGAKGLEKEIFKVNQKGIILIKIQTADHTFTRKQVVY